MPLDGFQRVLAVNPRTQAVVPLASSPQLPYQRYGNDTYLYHGMQCTTSGFLTLQVHATPSVVSYTLFHIPLGGGDAHNVYSFTTSSPDSSGSGPPYYLTSFDGTYATITNYGYTGYLQVGCVLVVELTADYTKGSAVARAVWQPPAGQPDLGAGTAVGGSFPSMVILSSTSSSPFLLGGVNVRGTSNQNNTLVPYVTAPTFFPNASWEVLVTVDGDLFAAQQQAASGQSFATRSYGWSKVKVADPRSWPASLTYGSDVAVQGIALSFTVSVPPHRGRGEAARSIN
jgi:hypothetical protein